MSSKKKRSNLKMALGRKEYNNGCNMIEIIGAKYDLNIGIL